MDSIFFQIRDYLASDTSNLQTQARAVFNLIVIAWGVHLLNWGICGGGLNQIFGLRPRQILGIPGIFLSHFLHDMREEDGSRSNSHIVGNTMVFAPMGLFIALQGLHFFYVVTIAVALSSGICLWLLGPSKTYVIGASGVTYGYRGFLLMYGITSGSAIAFIFTLVVWFIYDKAREGLLPQENRQISWQGHLFGFIGGVLTALVLSDIRLSP